MWIQWYCDSFRETLSSLCRWLQKRKLNHKTQLRRFSGFIMAHCKSDRVTDVSANPQTDCKCCASDISHLYLTYILIIKEAVATSLFASLDCVSLLSICQLTLSVWITQRQDFQPNAVWLQAGLIRELKKSFI